MFKKSKEEYIRNAKIYARLKIIFTILFGAGYAIGCIVWGISLDEAISEITFNQKSGGYTVFLTLIGLIIGGFFIALGCCHAINSYAKDVTIISYANDKLFEEKTAPLPTPPAETGEIWDCPICGKRNSMTHTVCSDCEFDPRSVITDINWKEEWTCPECARRQPQNVIACRCGYIRTDSEQEA